MDGALVHSENKIPRKDYSKLEWVAYIPLAIVPKDLVEQFKDREFNYESFLLWSKSFDMLPNIWTLGCFDNNKIVGFLYGFWNPLEAELEVKRFTCYKEYYSYKGNIVKEAIQEVYKLGNKFKVKHMYFVGDQWKVWLKKAPDDLHLTKYRVLEGY